MFKILNKYFIGHITANENRIHQYDIDLVTVNLIFLSCCDWSIFYPSLFSKLSSLSTLPLFLVLFAFIVW